MVDEAVDGGDGGGFVGEDAVPLSEGLVGGDEEGAVFVACGDEFEEDAGFGLILGDVGEVVEDEEVVSVEASEQVGEGEVASGALHVLHEVGGSREEDAVSVFDEGASERGSEVALAGAGGSEEEEVGASGEPAVASREGHDLGFGEHGDGGELEVGERLRGEQAGVVEVAFDAAPGAFGEFVFGERGQEAGGGPALGVGAFAERAPQLFHGGEAELREHQLQGDGVRRGGGRLVLGHANPPVSSLYWSSGVEWTETTGGGSGRVENRASSALGSGSCPAFRLRAMAAASSASQPAS